MNNKEKVDYDLIIVGGAVSGGIMAALLGHSDLKIGIVESRVHDPEKPDPRVFAITRASEQIFRSAGIWNDLITEPMGYFREMEVWDANGSGTIHFDSKDLCEPTLGYIIENQRIQTALVKVIDNMKNVSWLCPEKVDQIEIHTNHADVFLDSGKRLKTKLIVGADGANSRIRDLVGIESKLLDYQQTAVVCSVKSQIAHNDVARQRFLTTGPLAFLPLADPHVCSIVWSTTPDHAQNILDSSPEDFHKELEQAFDSKLGSVLETSQRFSFPLNRAHVKNYVSNRVALIGDAAHRVHPLAGQGANLGILDAATLAEILLKNSDTDVGRYALLRKYERQRKGENLSVIAAMDGFKHLFGSTLEPVQWLRNFGMDLTNSCPPVKKIIMQKAMGLKGELPELARTPDFL